MPWSRYTDETSGEAYLFNAETGESTWESKSSTETCWAPRDEIKVTENLPNHMNEPEEIKKDYIHMAQVYRNQKHYRDLDLEPLCCCCKKEVCLDVIFPCEHKCICRSCQREMGIGETANGAVWSFCPLCCGEIKRIFPHDGHEREKYWQWVMAIKPRLPEDFRDRFEFAGAYLRQKDGVDDNDPIPSCVCLIS